MLEQLGMELVYEYNFPDAIGHYMKERRESMDLLRRMDALETVEQAKMNEIAGEEYGPAIARFKAAGGTNMIVVR